MQAKKALAGKIVADFHSVEAAAKAAEDWAKQFQKDQVPEDLSCIDVELADIEVDPDGKRHGAILTIGQRTSNDRNTPIVRLDKLIRQAGLANSNSDAASKLKSGAVNVDGEAVGDNNFLADMAIGSSAVLRVGRRMAKVRLVDLRRGS
jgi:tyrosyl-tRNA synthetase